MSNFIAHRIAANLQQKNLLISVEKRSDEHGVAKPINVALYVGLNSPSMEKVQPVLIV